MNCSSNMKQYRGRHGTAWGIVLIPFLVGILIGFLLGKIPVHATAPSPDPVPAPAPTMEPIPTPTPEPECLGTYRITAYCPCEICCGEWANNRPGGVVCGAAGVELTPGLSCASPLPFGTVVEIEGLGEYTVQDRMADWVVEKYDGEVVDIYFTDHDAARAFGCQYLKVYQKECAPC